MVSPICGLHTWVFHLLALELVMLSVMAVGVLYSVAHMRPWSVSLCTHTHNYLCSSKYAALWSRQLAHITAVGYITSICSFSLLSHFSSLIADSLPLYPARYRQRLLISSRHCFTEGFCAALPWQTVRLHSDYEELNIVWQPFPREGLTIMFH